MTTTAAPASTAAATGIAAAASLLLRTVSVLCLAVIAHPALATRHALLVGVGVYPALPADFQLQAPARDVELMRRVLLERGFEPGRIEVLADGVAGARPPTRGAILQALQDLAARVRIGDTVYLHFSGHGSLQPVPRASPGASGGSAPRDWQPIFLPRDVARWNGQNDAVVPNAITDSEWRALLDRLNDTGAFVFAAFDACQSARLVRGAAAGAGEAATAVHMRQVDPAVLGITGSVPPLDVRPKWVTAAASSPVTRGVGAAAQSERGRAVYFYAAHSMEFASSRPLPDGRGMVAHGLFTWHLAQALAMGAPVTYRQLGQHLLSRYDQLPATEATPLFGGDGLDEPVFGQQAASVRQWPLGRHGDQQQLWLSAGALSGVAEGALLAVLSDPLAAASATPLQAPDSTLGFVRVEALEDDRARVAPVAWQRWAALPPSALPARGVWARLIVNPPSFALRVAIDSVNCVHPCAPLRVLDRLRRDGVPGVDVRWVAAGVADAAAAADVRLRAERQGIRLLLPDSAGATATGDWGVAAPAQVNDDETAVEAQAQAVAGALHRLARMRNLMQLAARLALRPPGNDAVLTLTVRHAGRDTAASSERLLELTPGDTVLIDGRNAGADPLDVAAFWLGADQSVRQIYPTDRRDSARLAPGEHLRRAGWSIDPGTSGTERLIVLTRPMRRGHETSDFRFLEQSPLSRLRGGAVDPELQALFDACFADYTGRGETSPAAASDRLALQMFTFRIRP